MTAGTYISGSAHLILILCVVLGGVLFRAHAPEMFETADVSLLSAEEFAALQPNRAAPEAAQEVETPAAPSTEDSPDSPDSPSASDAPETPAPRPEIADPVDPDAAPDKPDRSVPQTDVDDNAPDGPLAPATDSVTALLPPATDAGRPRDLPRVAPLPAPEAPDLAKIAPDVVAPGEATPDPLPDATPVEETAASAPEAATTEIVTEAEEEGTSAPPTSVRPPRAPARQAAKPDAPAQDPVAAAITEAVAGATPEDTTPTVPAGPPLSFGEKESLRVAVGNCWNWNALSTAAQRVTVVVYVRMNPDGTPEASSIKQLSAKGGEEKAIRAAYEAAKRAIRRCGAGGLPLPSEKFSHWREIEMTFNPNKMAIK